MTSQQIDPPSQQDQQDVPNTHIPDQISITPSEVYMFLSLEILQSMETSEHHE